MKPWINSPRVSNVLDTLYAEAARSDPRIRRAARNSIRTARTEAEHYYNNLREAFIPVWPEFGNLLYTLARSSRARNVVEFGTSFGISTIYLASAVRDNGDGRVITTEFVPEKAERAKKNLAAAGLANWVDIRIGDARETLSAGLGTKVDMLFLDGAKGLYLPVLKLLEPRLRKGAIIASDNTDQDRLKGFLKYVRSQRNGYLSSAMLSTHRTTTTGHELTIRL
jgi:predicted O-methyltransferase YrrM